MLLFFTTLDGRIGRMRFWLLFIGVSALLVTAMLAAMLLIVSFTSNVEWIGSWWFNLFLILLSYPPFVIYVKRGHDRNLPAWVMAAYYGAVIVQQMLSKLGWLGITPDQHWYSPGNLIAEIVMALLTIAGLYLLFELGFRPGTQGSNRYGPDPLARQFRTNTTRVRRRVVEDNGAA